VALIFYSRQPDSRLLCETTGIGPVYRVVCLFAHSFHLYFLCLRA